MKSLRLIVVSLLAVGACLLGAMCAESQDNTASGDEVIRSLSVQRRDVLRQIVEVLSARHRDGTGSLEDVILAKNDVLEAELLLAETNDELVKIHQQRLLNFRTLEAALAKRHTSGLATIEQTLSCKAKRLAAEIALRRQLQAASD